MNGYVLLVGRIIQEEKPGIVCMPSRLANIVSVSHEYRDGAHEFVVVTSLVDISDGSILYTCIIVCYIIADCGAHYCEHVILWPNISDILKEFVVSFGKRNHIVFDNIDFTKYASDGQ